MIAGGGVDERRDGWKKGQVRSEQRELSGRQYEWLGGRGGSKNTWVVGQVKVK